MSQGFIGGLQVVRRPHCRFISLALALLKSDTDIPVGQSRPRGGGGSRWGGGGVGGGEESGERLLYPLGGLWLGLG